MAKPARRMRRRRPRCVNGDWTAGEERLSLDGAGRDFRAISAGWRNGSTGSSNGSGAGHPATAPGP